MNETIKVINSRRSIRQYKPDQIADSELQQILDCALYAPNARNQQMWHFSVIQDKDLLDRMVDITKENMKNSGIEFLIGRAGEPGYHTYYHAPTLIIISGKEDAMFIQIDCGAAAQNIALAAKSLKIGSCIMTSSGLLFQSQEGNNLKKEIGIPDGYNHVCAVALGYMDGDAPEAPPKNRDVITYIK